MIEPKNQLCEYYQGIVNKERCWFVTASLRSFDHMVFDRALVKETNLMEFFVPPLMEKEFLAVMEYFIAQGLVSELKKLPNRLADQNVPV